ncbi:cell surface A33 antigen-like isoform X2 [Osmerus mordax]|uniref:cell surface A33 antigen-like isoform X2 n=1 Tax=Osmerus mordax TaxID=8014 RepID=UPI00350FB583
MATERKIFGLSILCLVVQAAVCLQVSIPQKNYEYARGDNITIPCKYTPKKPDNKLVIVTWTAKSINPDEPDTIVLTSYSSVSTVDVTDTYEGRASIEEDVPTGKANLRLLSIGLQDNMDFECHVSIPGDDTGVLAATARLIVLVAPSPPLCKIQGSAEYGQNINLTCVSAEGSPTPTYSWQRRDVSNIPRPQDGRTTDKNGLLSLFNVSTETSGYYICTSANKIRSATCNVTLSVMPPSMNLRYTAGIAGAVVAAIILLIVIICCCRRRNKNKGQEDYEMGAPDAEFSDKEPQEGRGEEVRSVEPPRNAERRNEREYDRRSDYDDRRSDYNDRRSDYDDRRSDIDDRRSDYTDHRSDYDARSDNNTDRRDRYDDRRDRDYKDSGHDDRYDEPYDDRPPRVPANKPVRKDYED